ncbi:hypothetical protein JKP88DRAFT_274189 [Tribonema minus]|uniref:Uncharacterized protein n=1 Tax=Tribonema minus TaxID=303371 RepID=A0A836C9T4_9STRA|nr:hypothetical protein JKP88DRAFT_274189 [Tribonema minus]
MDQELTAVSTGWAVAAVLTDVIGAEIWSGSAPCPDATSEQEAAFVQQVPLSEWRCDERPLSGSFMMGRGGSSKTHLIEGSSKGPYERLNRHEHCVQTGTCERLVIINSIHAECCTLSRVIAEELDLRVAPLRAVDSLKLTCLRKIRIPDDVRRRCITCNSDSKEQEEEDCDLPVFGSVRRLFLVVDWPAGVDGVAPFGFFKDPDASQPSAEFEGSHRCWVCEDACGACGLLRPMVAGKLRAEGRGLDQCVVNHRCTRGALEYMVKITICDMAGTQWMEHSDEPDFDASLGKHSFLMHPAHPAVRAYWRGVLREGDSVKNANNAAVQLCLRATSAAVLHRGARGAADGYELPPGLAAVDTCPSSAALQKWSAIGDMGIMVAVGGAGSDGAAAPAVWRAAKS